MPKVSVILSSYNHAPFIAESVNSVLNQTFEDFELLIFDDGSTDNSQEIIRSFHDDRIRLFLYSENRGPFKATQEALNEASGEYIAIHHSDDIWESDKLEKQVNFLDSHSEYGACFTQVKFIDENSEFYNLPDGHPYKNIFRQKNRTREDWLNHFFWHMNCLCNPSALIRNDKKLLFMDACFFQLPDYAMWINLCMKKNIYVLEEELIKFRLRRYEQNSVSAISIEKSVRNANEAYFVLRQFLPLLKNHKEFTAVFPESAEYQIEGKMIIEFAFAQLCLRGPLQSYKKLGLEILFDLLHNATKATQIKRLYDYDAEKFIADTGFYDIFGVGFQLRQLRSRLYLDFGEGLKEDESVAQSILVRPDNFFSAQFRIPIKQTLNAFRFDPHDEGPLSVKILEIIANGQRVTEYTSNAAQEVNGYHEFFTADPSFYIPQKISESTLHLQILGIIKTDTMLILEKKYSDMSATVAEKTTILNHQTLTIKNQATAIETQNTTINNQSATIENQNATISNQSATIETQNATISNQSATIDNQNATISNQSATIETQNTMISNQSATIDNQNTTISNQSATIDNQNATISNQSATIDNQIKFINEQSAVIKNQNAKISEQTTTINNQTMMINNQSMTIRNQADMIKNQRENLERQSMEIDNQTELLNSVLGSSSWKLTKPLRIIGAFVKNLIGGK